MRTTRISITRAAGKRGASFATDSILNGSVMPSDERFPLFYQLATGQEIEDVSAVYNIGVQAYHAEHPESAGRVRAKFPDYRG